MSSYETRNLLSYERHKKLTKKRDKYLGSHGPHVWVVSDKLHDKWLFHSSEHTGTQQQVEELTKLTNWTCRQHNARRLISKLFIEQKTRRHTWAKEKPHSCRTCIEFISACIVQLKMRLNWPQTQWSERGQFSPRMHHHCTEGLTQISPPSYSTKLKRSYLHLFS